jgi:branched-subunit amino acid aminotransferase/4-amino-4-deoxychorismate lyase
MIRSAHELGIPLDPKDLPDEAAVQGLLSACQTSADVLLRITCSGGTSQPTPVLQASAGRGVSQTHPGRRRAASGTSTDTGAAVVWMRVAELPPPPPPEGLKVATSWVVARDDPLAHHKSINYWRLQFHHQLAGQAGFDEVLSRTPDRAFWEGTRTNLFLVIGNRLLTPRASGPILPGIMRSLVLERAKGLGVPAVEGRVTESDFQEATEAFLTNAVRGILPVGHCLRRFDPIPGPVTSRLWDDVLQWLLRPSPESSSPSPGT